jgi:hypothetical protein
MWCEFCQETTLEDHFDEDDNHKIGYEWGPEGKTLRELQILNKVMDHSIDMWHEFVPCDVVRTELHEFLGLSWEEYKDWVQKDNVV